LRWILMDAGITCAIPGAKRPDQVDQNVAASDLPPLTNEQMRIARHVYDRNIRAHVHRKW
jgi:aryl-alcohol dehydrogenase-like predicted oxidoreductase